MSTRLTLLHSNDLHGDFLPKTDENGKQTGGLSRLSGYVKKTRADEENVIYANAGDMFRGSIIDSEFMGLSTIELMNLLSPDVTTIGNHEVDYGLAHLLFPEKCAHFPIINSNLFITINNARLFMPCLNVEAGGLKVLFIGILTEEVIASMKSEKVIGTYVDVNLYADLLQWESSFDIMIMGTGAIRKKQLGPIVEYQDMLENTPFDDVLWMLKVTGKQFRQMIAHVFRDEAWEGHTEFYNYSKGVKIVYRKSTHTFEELSFRGKEIEDTDEFLIAMQAYHYGNFDEFFGTSLEEVKATPHKDCGTDTQSDFSSDCLNLPQEY